MQSGKWLAELEKPILIIQEGLAKACFATGTKLWTPQGYRAIEEIRAGDSVFSRDEWNPATPVEAKVVEEVFQRFARVLDLRVAGQSIRTTGEHPFYAAGLGWTPANELQSGMELLTASGEWVRVDGLDDTGEWEVVYNLRVADHHTYFVGDQDWGWAAWAHNLCWGDAITNSGKDQQAVDEHKSMNKNWPGKIHGHHIVMKDDRNSSMTPWIKQAKAILRSSDVGIDPYDVYATRTEKMAHDDALADKRAGKKLYNLVWAINQDHSKEYAKAVYEYLEYETTGKSGPMKKNAVIEVLDRIGTILANGQRFRFDSTTNRPYGMP